MSFSNYLENAVLDHVFGGSGLTAPTAWYVKLHTGDPGEDCTANAAGETTRAEVTSWNAASGGAKTNAADVDWVSVSTAETYSHVSVWDAATGGNPLGKGALSPNREVVVNDDFTIEAGDLSITLD